MLPELELVGQIHQGHFPSAIRLQLADTMRRMEGKRVAVKLYEPQRASSSPQRRYYFSVIVESIRQMFADAGTILTKAEMHEWMKKHIGKLVKEVITPEGEITHVLRSYKKLTTQEAEAYHLQCRQWAAERGCDVPEPNEEI